MSKTNIDSELRARVESFVADLSEIIRRSALESVREALGAEGAAPRRVARTTRATGARRAATGAGRKSSKSGRVRRSSADLERLSADFLAYVKAHPGERLEQIGVGMGVPTKELKRPVQLLLEAGQVRTEGQRRGTRYFAGTGAPARKVSKKRKSTRKKTKARRKTTKRKSSGRKSAKKAT